MNGNNSLDQRDRNLDATARLYKDFAQRDLDAVATQLAPDVVWTEPDNPFNPAAGTRYGLEGFREWVRLGNQAEEILVFEPEQFLANDCVVVVIGFQRCMVRSSGCVYESDFVHVLTFVDGKVKRFQEFFDTYAAAEAFRQSPPRIAAGK